jgi:hypothetical protein
VADAYCPWPRSSCPGARRAERKTRVPWIWDVDRGTDISTTPSSATGEREPDLSTWQEAHDDVLRQRSGFVWIGLH